MKRLIYSFAISSLLASATVAQTPKPAARPATTNPAPSTPTPSGGTGAEGKFAQITVAQLGQGVNELKVKIDALNSEFLPMQKELKAMEEELLALKNKIQSQGAAYQSGVLVWAVPVADITDELMKEYNKANPVAAGAAPPAGAKKP